MNLQTFCYGYSKFRTRISITDEDQKFLLQRFKSVMNILISMSKYFFQLFFEFRKQKFHENQQKKGTLEIFWTHFRVLHLKQSSEFMILAFHDNSLKPKITKCEDPLQQFLQWSKDPNGPLIFRLCKSADLCKNYYSH